MELVRLIQDRVRRAPTLSPDELRKSKPLRNPIVEFERAEDGTTLLTAPLEAQGNGIAATLAKWMKSPVTKKIELEPIGGLVWELCDGKTSFDAISRKLRDRYKMNRLEADASLTAFLKLLSQRGLITLLVGSKK